MPRVQDGLEEERGWSRRKDAGTKTLGTVRKDAGAKTLGTVGSGVQRRRCKCRLFPLRNVLFIDFVRWSVSDPKDIIRDLEILARPPGGAADKVSDEDVNAGYFCHGVFIIDLVLSSLILGP